MEKNKSYDFKASLCGGGMIVASILLIGFKQSKFFIFLGGYGVGMGLSLIVFDTVINWFIIKKSKEVLN